MDLLLDRGEGQRVGAGAPVHLVQTSELTSDADVLDYLMLYHFLFILFIFHINFIMSF